jgi:hypothetical protein
VSMSAHSVAMARLGAVVRRRMREAICERSRLLARYRSFEE